MRNRFRRGASFIADPRQHSRPLDRNERARIIHLAEALEHRTRPAGARNGVVSQIGLRVLRSLLLRFHRGRDGLCCPSYTVLQAATGLCRQSIARALQRLEAAGILRITRRLVRETIDGGGFMVTVARQGSNLYAVFAPSEHADKHAASSTKPRPFPRPALAGLAALLGWKAASLRDRRKPTFGFQERAFSAPKVARL